MDRDGRIDRMGIWSIKLRDSSSNRDHGNGELITSDLSQGETGSPNNQERRVRQTTISRILMRLVGVAHGRRIGTVMLWRRSHRDWVNAPYWNT